MSYFQEEALGKKGFGSYNNNFGNFGDFNGDGSSMGRGLFCKPSMIFGGVSIAIIFVYMLMNYKNLYIPTAFIQMFFVMMSMFILNLVCSSKPKNIAWIITIILILFNVMILICHKYNISLDITRYMYPSSPKADDVPLVHPDPVVDIKHTVPTTPDDHKYKDDEPLTNYPPHNDAVKITPQQPHVVAPIGHVVAPIVPHDKPHVVAPIEHVAAPIKPHEKTYWGSDNKHGWGSDDKSIGKSIIDSIKQ
jgi:hypothetical protein